MPSVLEAGRPLVVATYNVHACVGIDRRYDPDRVAAVIRELDADIVALQEVAARDRRGTLIDEFAYLAKMTGFEGVPGPNLVDRRGQFGNAVLTRWPVAAVRRIDLSVPGREPRGALDLDFDIDGKGIRVIATHLGLGPGERRQQIVRLRELLTDQNAMDGRTRLLLGDLNEWRRNAGGPLGDAFGRAPSPSTFPSWCPVLPLDRIFALDSQGPVEFCVHKSRLARLASDHLPLRATVPLS